MLLGEAAVLGSPALLIWCAVFLASNWAFFRMFEEPGLVRRFGDEYGEYKRNVPRWISRRTPLAPGRYRARDRATTSWSVPDSAPQTSPSRPSSWRTFAPGRASG